MFLFEKDKDCSAIKNVVKLSVITEYFGQWSVIRCKMPAARLSTLYLVQFVYSDLQLHLQLMMSHTPKRSVITDNLTTFLKA